MLTLAAILYYKKLEDKMNQNKDLENNVESIGISYKNKVLNRWHVYVTLINNPQLVKYRKSQLPKLDQ